MMVKTRQSFKKYIFIHIIQNKKFAVFLKDLYCEGLILIILMLHTAACIRGRIVEEMLPANILERSAVLTPKLNAVSGLILANVYLVLFDES